MPYPTGEAEIATTGEILTLDLAQGKTRATVVFEFDNPKALEHAITGGFQAPAAGGRQEAGDGRRETGDGRRECS